MLKKFRDGFIFGLGFSLACVLVAYLSMSSNELMVIDSTSMTSSNPNLSSYESSESISNKFHELPIDDQIDQASVIAVARFKEAPDGQMKAIIEEFLKKDEGTTIYYEVGSEFTSSSFYPKEKIRYGDGIVIFFTGSPASMRMSMTFTGERINGLGDLPLILLRKKCESSSA